MKKKITYILPADFIVNILKTESKINKVAFRFLCEVTTSNSMIEGKLVIVAINVNTFVLAIEIFCKAH